MAASRNDPPKALQLAVRIMPKDYNTLYAMEIDRRELVSLQRDEAFEQLEAVSQAMPLAQRVNPRLCGRLTDYRAAHGRAAGNEFAGQLHRATGTYEASWGPWTHWPVSGKTDQAA